MWSYRCIKGGGLTPSVHSTNGASTSWVNWPLPLSVLRTDLTILEAAVSCCVGTTAGLLSPTERQVSGTWAVGSDPARTGDAAINYATAGDLVPASLKAVH